MDLIVELSQPMGQQMQQRTLDSVAARVREEEDLQNVREELAAMKLSHVMRRAKEAQVDARVCRRRRGLQGDSHRANS